MKKFLIRIKYWLNESKRKIFYTLNGKKNIKIGEKNVFVFLAADYGNIGDIAITYAQKDFIRKNLPDYTIIEVGCHDTHASLPYLRRKIKPKDIVTIIGGGNMTDRYDEIEELRRMVIKTFKKNKIVSFPQTVEFSNNVYGNEAMKRSQKIYSKCKNLTIFAREKKSYLKMKEIYNQNIIKLVPDIVISLKGRLTINNDIPRQGVGICFRSDKEVAINDAVRQKTIEYLKDDKIEYLSTYIEDDVFEAKNKEKNLLDLLAKISSKEIFITDRLHGMIFCYLTNTPCIAFDNDNHKISETYKLWLKDCNYITMLESKDIIKIGEMINKMKLTTKKEECMEEKFEELKKALIL